MMKILFLCGREAYYPLNHFLIEGLRQFSNVDVVLERGSGKSILKRSLLVTINGLIKSISSHYDLILISFFGHLLILPFSMFSGKPILFHPLISAYETLVFDRQKTTSHSLPARLAFWLDKTACSRATHIILDTQANIQYFSKTFSEPLEKFHRIFVGCDERIFFPQPAARQDGRIVVIYQGSYLPLHGIDVIIHAAKSLRTNPKIHFQLIGRGMGYERISQLAIDLRLTNIEFLESIPFYEMPRVIADADICLGGHFSKSKKAARVIAGKTFQDIAMGKATIVGDVPANYELLTHRHDAWFCPPEDPEALAQGIQTLADEASLRFELGRNARLTFLEKASLQAQVPELKKIIEQLVG
jgi:glycosyltransferase involved in cell wall biosynthesis